MRKLSTIYLEDNEMKALLKLAIQEKRDARQQAAYIISKWLESQGLLEPLSQDENEIGH